MECAGLGPYPPLSMGLSRRMARLLPGLGSMAEARLPTLGRRRPPACGRLEGRTWRGGKGKRRLGPQREPSVADFDHPLAPEARIMPAMNRGNLHVAQPFDRAAIGIDI